MTEAEDHHDAGILWGCSEYAHRTDVKASSLQKPETWLIQQRIRISRLVIKLEMWKILRKCVH